MHHYTSWVSIESASQAALNPCQARAVKHPSGVTRIADAAAGVFVLHPNSGKSQRHEIVVHALSRGSATRLVVCRSFVSLDVLLLLVLLVQTFPNVCRVENRDLVDRVSLKQITRAALPRLEREVEQTQQLVLGYRVKLQNARNSDLKPPNLFSLI